MRLVTFIHQNETHLGVLVSRERRNFVFDFQRAQLDLPNDLLQFLHAGESSRSAAQQALVAPNERALVAEADVTFLPPVPRPGKLICVGHNYRDHAVPGDPEEFPTFFAKFANVLIGHNQPIVYPSFPIQLDYEAELAVVMGKRARNVDQARALDCVAGYTIFNDVTARDYQAKSSQWSIRKSFDTFGPLGPALVTSDEIPDPGNLDLTLMLNGVELQKSNTRNLIFSIPFLISYLARSMTLEPGDVIATGTPSGTGASRKPPIFMKPGDQVCIQIDQVGKLVNPIVETR